MPIGSTMNYVKHLLDGLKVPGQKDLVALVKPRDPETFNDHPTAYVWSADGDELRSSSPRSAPPLNTMGHYRPIGPAGWKFMNHSLTVWLTWFNDNNDPRADIAFPAVIDIVMMTLRTTKMPSPLIEDPLTGYQTQLIDLGKNMKWKYVPVRAVAQQRWERFDAEITAPVEEWFQA